MSHWLTHNFQNHSLPLIGWHSLLLILFSHQPRPAAAVHCTCSVATLFVGLSGTNLPSHFVQKFKSVNTDMRSHKKFRAKKTNFRGAFGLFSQKYPKGGPLENFFFSFLLNPLFYSERSWETIEMPFGGLRLLKCPKWANFEKFWKNSENMQRGDT